VETLVLHYGQSGSTDLSTFRLVRVLRVVRSVRVVRVFRFFRELRILLLSLFNSMKPLLWGCMCLFLIIFLVSAILAQGVSDHFLQDTNKPLHNDQTSQLLVKFNSLPRVFLALLESITGGDDWLYSYLPLTDVGGGYSLLFLMYICTMCFCVLNVITGVFVESAMSKARADNELAMQEEIIKKDDVMKQLMRIFKRIDDDMSGSIDYLEWESFTDKREAHALFASLGLDVSQTKDIFKLIDWDESGQIDTDEFVVGCMQLQGGAKVLDVETLMRNHKKMFNKFAHKIEEVETLIETNMAEMKIYLSRLFTKYNAEQPEPSEFNERSWV